MQIGFVRDVDLIKIWFKNENWSHLPALFLVRISSGNCMNFNEFNFKLKFSIEFKF